MQIRCKYTPYGKVTLLNSTFGTTSIPSIGNTHFYTGRELDAETGLQLNRKRFYASHLGRWVTSDPIGYEGSRWNLYEYMMSRPIVLTDAFGLYPSPITVPTNDGCTVNQMTGERWCPPPKPPGPPGPILSWPTLDDVTTAYTTPCPPVDNCVEEAKAGYKKCKDKIAQDCDCASKPGL